MTKESSDVLEGLIHENDKLQATIQHLEARMQQIASSMNTLSPAVQEVRNRNDSLTAMVNYAITEFPSSRASIYMKGVLENLFSTATTTTK